MVGASAEVASAPGTDPASALSALVVLLCAAVTGGWWLWLVGSTVATTVVAQRAAPRVPHFLLPPRILRGALGLAVGTSLGSLIVTPCVASPVDGDRRPGPVPVLPGALVGLRVPDRVVGGAPPARHPRPAHRRVTRVRPGDSLWSIAAGLVRRPTATRVALTWPALYAANRSVIGADPDLIHPGTRLVVPAALRRDRPNRGGRQ